MQRQIGFNGGVQVGTKATSDASSGLEKGLRVVALGLDTPGLRHVSGLAGVEIARRLGTTAVLAGVYPDGGVWLDDDGNIAMAAEAKYQGPVGNAIERWYKNWAVLDALGCRRYVTFCSGDGFFGNSAARIMELAMVVDQPGKPVTWNTPGNKLWMYRYKTLDEARMQMEEVLRGALSSS